jgi:hypothetical protein
MTSSVGAAVLVTSVALLTAVTPDQPQADTRAATARTVAYLRTEVPRWRLEHPCYSCHNNGDAMRALLAASARGHVVADAIGDTVAWLATPERWDSNARRGGSEEQPLARIQFASALASMVAAGRAEAAALDRAAGLLVVHQQDDGSWRMSDTQIVGGATFYGTSLATAMARRILVRAKVASVQSSLAKASGWLRTTSPITVLDASAVLLGLERDSDPAAAGPTTTVARDPPARPGPRRWLGSLRDVAVGGVRHRAWRCWRWRDCDPSMRFRPRPIPLAISMRPSNEDGRPCSARRTRTAPGPKRPGHPTATATRSASRRPRGR